MNAVPLWIVLAVSVVISLGGLGAGMSPEAKAGVEAQARDQARRRAGWWATFGCSTMLLTMLLLPAAWIWEAVVTGDWRFGAIGVVPLVCALLREPFRRRWAANARREERQTTVKTAAPEVDW